MRRVIIYSLAVVSILILLANKDRDMALEELKFTLTYNNYSKYLIEDNSNKNKIITHVSEEPAIVKILKTDEKITDVEHSTNVKESNNNIEESEVIMEKSVTKNEEETEKYNQRVGYAVTAYLEHGKKEESLELLENVLYDDPTNIEALQALGMIYDQMGEGEKYIERYRGIIDSFPDNIDIYSDFIRFCREHSYNINDEADILRYGAEQNPDNQEFKYFLGDYFKEKWRYDEAVEQYLLALDINNNDSRSHFYIGQLFFEMGQNSLAENHFNTATQLSEELSLEIEEFKKEFSFDDSFDI